MGECPKTFRGESDLFYYSLLTIYDVCASLQSFEAGGVRQQSFPIKRIYIVTRSGFLLFAIDAGHLVEVDERVMLRAEAELFGIFHGVSAVQVLYAADERRGIVAGY